MSDYFDFPPEDWDAEEDASPFRGLPGWVEPPAYEDPYIRATEEIMSTFGVESFEGIIFNPEQVNPDTIRGNRFETLEDAMMYLFDSGVFSFSGVVMDGDDIEVYIDDCTQPPCD